MSRIRIAVALGAAALVAAVGTGSALAAGALKGTDGPGFTITFSAKTVKAGTYKIVISDKSNIHNFHLTGPGTNKKTSVGATGTTTWTVTLKKGTYKYVCDPHASSMKGSFKVT
jgi:plastocyanin